MKAKVEILAREIKGRPGYDVIIRDPDATVADYLGALNQAIRELPFDRDRAPGRNSCYGCQQCCAERLPLTWTDYLNLREAVAPKAGPGAFLATYGYVLVNGPVVDIILAADTAGRCCFLDPDRGICRVYSSRPLVCQTFICYPSTTRARRLRATLVNQGEDELVRQWLLEARRNDKPPVIHAGYQPRPHLRDWPPTPFAGKNYHQVTLKAVCPRDLWQQLTKKII